MKKEEKGESELEKGNQIKRKVKERKGKWEKKKDRMRVQDSER